MRAGRMTFRKVGDSTRFLKEDLDAMVSVHPGSKGSAAIGEPCPLCNHGELVPGYMQSFGRVYFRPEKMKLSTFRDGNIRTIAKMCSRCGAVQWQGDIRKLEEVRDEEAPETAEG